MTVVNSNTAATAQLVVLWRLLLKNFLLLILIFTALEAIEVSFDKEKGNL